MKLFLKCGVECFKAQLEYLQNHIDISVCRKEADADVSLSAENSGNEIDVERNGKIATIKYNNKHGFFRGLLLLLKSKNDLSFKKSETSIFDLNGIMIDNSRNAVMTVESTKTLIAYSALMGFDHIELYIEDTLEVQNQPLFGYMRMRYTKDEIKELNTFAKGFGIKLVPCIQTLAHLNQAMRWSCYSKIRDIDDILLVGSEQTYSFLEDVISTWRECVDSDIIHIGMDEAHNLGRGRFLDNNGLKSRFEIMCSHLKRVAKICKKYDFKPMMWSDMFIRALNGNGDYYADNGLDKSLLDVMPDDVKLFYWDYYTISQADYDKQMKKHLLFNNEIGFAGGAWKWNGFLPQISHSLEVSRNALNAARENKISSILVTAWGDDGAECPIFSVLPVLALFGESGYNESVSDSAISDTVFALSGYTLEDYFTLEAPNATALESRDRYQNNAAKYLLYQDVLLGMFDKNIGVCDSKHFKDCAKKLKALSENKSEFACIFDSAYKLCDVLEIKCDIGVRLKAAYDENDKSTLSNILNNDIPLLKIRLCEFHKAFKNEWYFVNKRGGFDVQDIRLGGLAARICSAEEILKDYLNGKIQKIEELEQERLPFDLRNDLNGRCTAINSWGAIATPNKL